MNTKKYFGKIFNIDISYRRNKYHDILVYWFFCPPLAITDAEIELDL